ncbi:1-aminocyclopropane-1-carboxylate oxidase homolog 1-like [Tasmannia lanceolata]|uniref:1-aminocyclopropane-1-carboxylate oxidase homolog 1-like n=1 Tax=Tasmannia lanceolata TaxID=3420 RepID=UPI0040636B86
MNTQQLNTDSVYDRTKEVKQFDDSKIGVKGLVDSGILKIPRFFIHPPENLPNKVDPTPQNHLQVPVIDLAGIYDSRRKEIVDEIRRASENWGFFQTVNHGIPSSVLDGIIEGVRKFHEQPKEDKMEIYTREFMKKVRFSTNYDLLQSRAANWRDTFTVLFDGLDPEEIPPLCRDIMMDYSKHVMRLGETLSELLSEALGLGPDYLKKIQCTQTLVLTGHYYPACPEPEQTLGTGRHSDPDFLTILLQDQIGGLQVIHQQCWVDVPPIPGALVVNIGDLLQLMTNDKLKSVGHRVLASHIGPRISVACFFNGSREEKSYGPIVDLLSDDNPPKYREIKMRDFLQFFLTTELDEKNCLDYCKL